MSTRTFTPARARSLSASTNCVSSLPADHTNVSRCTLCFAAAMSASIAGKIAPFCSTVALLPSWTALSVRPAISGSASLISGYSSGSSSRYGVPRARVSRDEQRTHQRGGDRGSHDPCNSGHRRLPGE